MAEIKISELSIGDWVEINDFNKVLIKRVSAIDGTRNQIGIIKNNRGGIYWYCDDEISPIPLTPEILEKNGFRKLDRFNEYVIGEWDSNPFIAVRLAEKFVEPTILVKNGGTSAHLFGPRGENVHQLQHALRSAGVEKEIEI